MSIFYSQSKQTSDQMLRDKAVISFFRETYVDPLQSDLDTLVPGYKTMSDVDKLVALLRLNEEHAPNGSWLLVDFGSLLPYWDTECAFYAGIPLVSDYQEEPDGPRMFKPRYTFKEGLGSYRSLLIISDGKVGTALIQPDIIFTEDLPITFKLAVIAHTLMANAFVDLRQACRFVAGIGDDEPTPFRIRAREVETRTGQHFGWSIDIRDTYPSNKLMIDIAKLLRNCNDSGDSTLPSMIATNVGVQPRHAEHEQLLPGQHNSKGKSLSHKRGPRESTRTLLEFVDGYLPSLGYHVWRTGDGEKISWDDAFRMFCEKYPDPSGKRPSRWFGDAVTFKNRYYQLRSKGGQQS